MLPGAAERPSGGCGASAEHMTLGRTGPQSVVRVAGGEQRPPDLQPAGQPRAHPEVRLLKAEFKSLEVDGLAEDMRPLRCH